MSRCERGFGLIEIMLSLVLGLVVSLALTQLFISSKSTYLSQSSSAALQEDARFVLSKIAQEVRQAGAFGCLGSVDDASLGGGFSRAFRDPVQWDARQQSLTLTSTAVDNDRSWHTWMLHTDCQRVATAWSRGRAPRLKPGEIALPIRQQVYRFNEARGEITLDGQPLLSNVRAFGVLFGMADGLTANEVKRYTEQPDLALVRSIRLTLTLFDPEDRAQEQRFHLVAALRNRLG